MEIFSRDKPFKTGTGHPGTDDVTGILSLQNGILSGNLKPVPVSQVRPVQPMSLAPSAQYPYPLSFNLPFQTMKLVVTVVQCEILVETLQHPSQLLLLVSSLPVSV